MFLFKFNQVQLVGPVGPRLQKLLHPAIQVPEVSIADEDEIHMILEYHVGDTWGSSVAPVATRFITSFDESNGRASSLEAFFSSLEVFRPDLAVCTGLHLLEGQGPRVWYDRIPVLKAGLQALPDDLPVHMELASMANPEFVQLLLEQVEYLCLRFMKVCDLGRCVYLWTGFSVTLENPENLRNGFPFFQ